MNKGDEENSDGEVEKLVKWVQDDVLRETRRQQIDLERSEVYTQLREARRRGDAQGCSELERRMIELLEARRQVG